MKSMIRPRPVSLVAAAVALALGGMAVAQEKTDIPEDKESVRGTALTEVIVTGTRRADRTVAESSAPIDVLSGADLADPASGNMLDVLSSVVPSFIVGQNSISDSSSFVRAPSLRGLPGDQMLVMLNGKRFNRSALVQVFQGGETALSFGSQGPDLASIPSIAISSLEILRDGAVAQYGSDAIAGVLNYHFRENSSGVELGARYGSYYTGDYSNDGDDWQMAANVGLPLGGQGFVNLSLELAKNKQTVRNPTRPSALEFAEAFPDLAEGLPHFPGPVQQWGTGPSESVKAVINSGVNLDDDSQIYFFANVSQIDMDESFNYRLPVNFTGASGASYGRNPVFEDFFLTPCPTTVASCPAGGFVFDTNTFNYATDLYPSGYTPRFFGTTQEIFGALGYRGTTSGGMTYDVSGSLSQNYLNMSLRSSLNASMGPDTPTDFYIGKFQQQEANLNFDITYPWEVAAFASPITVAAGLEWRHENYQQILGDTASSLAGPFTTQPLFDCDDPITTCTPHNPGPDGRPQTVSHNAAANGFGGISTGVDASQRSYAGYVDLEADVLPRLTLGIAARFEDYSSFGSTTVGKIQARFEINDAIALRATASTGFHAPSPGQSNVETLSTTFIPGTTTQVQIGTYRVTSAIAQFFGATTLEPEESTNLSAGIVLTPIDSLVITLDAYRIEVDDRIGISQQFTVTQADIDNLAELAIVGIGGTVQYFTNGFDTKTEGVDLVGAYEFGVGAGRLQTTLAYNYNKSTVPSFDPLVITPARIVDIEHYAPNDRVNLSLDYNWDRIWVLLRGNYYGSFRNEQDYPGQLFSAKTTVDAEFAYQVTDQITASIGGRNIFDTMPDVVCPFVDSNNDTVNDLCSGDTINPLTGGLGDGQRFPRTGGPFGYNGAFFYVRVGVKF
ncbi:MAG: TonB-dependent receptor plug domain-containing protein [Woeseiaceae bacterium]